MDHCNCKDKTILVNGDGMFIASEYFCPKHGYQTSCYVCGANNMTTETCVRHCGKDISISHLYILPSIMRHAFECEIEPGTEIDWEKTPLKPNRSDQVFTKVVIDG